MGNKAVLNITKFSLGDSSSMASLLLPTIQPNQDVKFYDIPDELLTEGSLEEFCKGSTGEGCDWANAVFRYLSIIDPTFLERKFPEEEPESELESFSPEVMKVKLEESRAEDTLYGFYKVVNSWLLSIDESATIIYDYSPRKDRIPLLLDLIDATQDYDIDEQDPAARFYAHCVTVLKAHSLFKPDSQCTDEELDSFIEIVQQMLSGLNHGGTIDLGDGQTIELTGFDEMKELKRSKERDCQEFYQLVANLGNVENKNALKEQFELLRLRANGILLKKYVATSVEYPYFLDLNLDKATQTNEDSDADGSTMHTLEREVTLGDNWENNHLKGDRLRIRDMFRIDKLNKVSAYESFILTPGHYGVQKDNEMEQEDVVSRLMQDEMTAYGVVGMANTSHGLYFLTEPDDASSASSKSTALNQDVYSVYSTGTFKSFVTPFNERDNYLTVSHLSPRVGLLRHFGAKSAAYSSGEDFLSWYASYARSAVCKRGEVQGKASLLKIIGTDSYEWLPSKLGVKYLEGIYGSTEYEADEFRQVSHKLPSNGISIIASIGDDNYEQSVPRCFDIEVPCDVNAQYSYLTFGCELVVDPDLPTAAKEASIEFSLDDAAPVRFFLINNEKKPENLSEANPLYESVKQYDPEIRGHKWINPFNSRTDFKFIIENNLSTGTSRTFHVSITFTYAALRDIAASEDLKKSYANTFVRISNVSLPMQNREKEITYGDYHAFKTARGESIDDFWNLSSTMNRAFHQHILEVPHNIRMANNSVVTSNYTTASLFSDVITAKNHMDSEYRMQTAFGDDAFTLDRFRHYTGIDSCSDTVSLYYDADVKSRSILSKDNADPNLAQEYEVMEEKPLSDEDIVDSHIHELKYKRIETIKAINRFQHDMKHKSNLFSVRVRNSMTNETLAEAQVKYNNKEITEEQLLETEQAVKNVKTLITSAIEKICKDYAPAHNQLFKVYFD